MARLLTITSPLMSGPDVMEVQQRLAALGYDPGRIDGVFGVATLTAVTAFQTAAGLDADGLVGPQTLAALASARRRRAPRGQTQTQADPAGGARGVTALAEATRHLGVAEDPEGRTPFGAWFGVDGVAWCNMFVSYCFSVGAGYVICDGFAGAGVIPGKGCAYVPTTEAWLRATGMWRGRSEPSPGDLAIYNWNGGDPDHIGIVEQYLGGGKFTAIEGNASNAVRRCQRYLTQVDGFGRVG